MSLAGPFDSPFWFAQSSLPTSQFLYPVSIDGVGYLIDLKQQFQRSSTQVSTQRSKAAADDALLLPPDVWRRIRESWHQGDHQVMGDRDESLPYRFLDSRGVYVWDKWTMSLLNDAVLQQAITGTYAWCQVVNGYLMYVDGATMHMLSPTLVHTTATFAAPVKSATTDGVRAFVALTNGTIWSLVVGGAPVQVGSVSGIDFIAWAKDHLIAGAAGVLYDVAANGTTTTLPGTRPSTFRWVASAEGLACIYSLGVQGDSTKVYRIMLDPQTLALGAPIVACQLPDGEIGTALGSYMGYVFIGTDQGLRFGMPDNDGNLSPGALIETPNAVGAFEGQGRWVWFGLTNPDPSSTGLGRVDLTTWTQPLAPASATDLMVPGSAQGHVTTITTWQGQTWFGIPGQGYWHEDLTHKVPTGWLMDSDLTFGTPDIKIAYYARLRSRPMIGAASIDLSFDGGPFRVVGRIDAAGEQDSGSRYLDGVRYGRLNIRVTMTRDAAAPSQGPTVTRTEVTSEPVTGKASEWQIPIMVFDEMTVGGATYNRQTKDDFDALVDLVETGRVVTYREGKSAWQVHAVDYVWRPEKRSRLFDGFQGVFTILLREVR